MALQEGQWAAPARRPALFLVVERELKQIMMRNPWQWTSFALVFVALSAVAARGQCVDDFVDCNENGVHDTCDLACTNSVCDPVSGNITRCDLLVGAQRCGCPGNLNFNQIPDDCECFLGPEGTCPTMLVLIAARNEIPLGEPSAEVIAEPGDILTVEIYAKWWSHGVPHASGELDTLRGFQATFAYDSYVSGTTGNVLPVAFQQTSDQDMRCPNSPLPNSVANSDNAFIDTAHPRWVFSGLASAPTVNSRTCNYVFAAGTFADAGTPAGIQGIHQPAYLGTVKLVVSPNASGTFSLCLSDLDDRCVPNGPDASRLVPRVVPSDNSARIQKLNFECATVEIGTPTEVCDTLDIATAVPANGTIDPLQATQLDGTGAAGFTSVDVNVTLGANCDMADLLCNGNCSQWGVTTTPAGTGPSVTSVTQVDADTARVTLNGPIASNRWNSVCFLNGAQADTCTCLGSLPGDYNRDRTANPADVSGLVACLTNGSCTLEQGDMNRSGAVNPRDLIRIVDLMNGANAYEPNNGATLPPVPCS